MCLGVEYNIFTIYIIHFWVLFYECNVFKALTSYTRRFVTSSSLIARSDMILTNHDWLQLHYNLYIRNNDFIILLPVLFSFWLKPNLTNLPVDKV